MAGGRFRRVEVASGRGRWFVWWHSGLGRPGEGVRLGLDEGDDTVVDTATLGDDPVHTVPKSERAAMPVAKDLRPRRAACPSRWPAPGLICQGAWPRRPRYMPRPPPTARSRPTEPWRKP